MITITAIIRARKGCENAMRDALLVVAEHVRQHEAQTVGFFVSQDLVDPGTFTTYERFVDEAAMDRHNASAASTNFFAVARDLLDGSVTLVRANELTAKDSRA